MTTAPGMPRGAGERRSELRPIICAAAEVFVWCVLDRVMCCRSVRPIGCLRVAAGELVTFYWSTRRKTVRATASATRPNAIAFNAASSGANSVAVDSGVWRPSR